MISVDNLEKSIHRAINIHQDVKIPDGPIVIDKDLLKGIRDAFDNEAGDGNTYCEELRDKLDNLYPFLMKKLEAPKGGVVLGTKCRSCDGHGTIANPQPDGFINLSICSFCEGTGVIKFQQ